MVVEGRGSGVTVEGLVAVCVSAGGEVDDGAIVLGVATPEATTGAVQPAATSRAAPVRARRRVLDRAIRHANPRPCA
jgi:hypothetical protein